MAPVKVSVRVSPIFAATEEVDLGVAAPGKVSLSVNIVVFTPDFAASKIKWGSESLAASKAALAYASGLEL